MNSNYSLDADSRRWWWGPAVAGTFCAVAIASIVAISTGSTALSADPGAEPGAGTDRPCFIVQPRWNTALLGPQPTCALPFLSPDPPPRPEVLRPWLDFAA